MTRPMCFAFADPPYPGRAHLYRSVDRPDAEEVDHAALIDRLINEYPDGWALATDSRGLWTVIPLLVDRQREVRARLAVWHQPDAMPMGVGDPRGRDSRVAWAWEAVVFAGGRGRPGPLVFDLLSASSPERTRGFVGQKPSTYTAWVLRLLGVQPGDTVDDLFPGSGAFGRAVEAYLIQSQLWPAKQPRDRFRKSGKLRSSRGWRRPQDGLPLEVPA